MSTKNTDMVDLGIAVEISKMGMSNPEYIKSIYNEMLVSYPQLENMRSRKSDGTVSIRAWPNLDDMLRIKQRSSQDEMAKIATELADNDATRVLIHFYSKLNSRYYLGPCVEDFGNATLSITPMGDKSLCKNIQSQKHCFDSPEDDLIEGSILAGVTDTGEKRAFLVVKSNDGKCYASNETDENYVFLKDVEYHLFELESFSILSLSHSNDDSETGRLSIFNRTRKLLYSEYIIGSPTLQYTEPLFPSSMFDDKTNEINKKSKN